MLNQECTHPGINCSTDGFKARLNRIAGHPLASKSSGMKYEGTKL